MKSTIAYHSTQIIRIIYSDQNRLRQVILNLLGNSIKFTYEGYIKVIASPFIKSKNSLLSITVEDTGGGIAPEDLEKLFTAFGKGCGSKNPQGVGLGLMISKNIVELLDGEISVQSTKGKGTQFTIIIPYIENTSGKQLNKFASSEIIECKSNFYNAKSMVRKRRTVHM